MRLQVKVSPGKLVPDYDALDQGVLRYVGRRHDASVGTPLPTKKGQPKGLSGGFVSLEAVLDLPHRIEYLQELRSGALTPHDAETARLAGIDFIKKEEK